MTAVVQVARYPKVRATVAIGCRRHNSYMEPAHRQRNRFGHDKVARHRLDKSRHLKAFCRDDSDIR